MVIEVAPEEFEAIYLSAQDRVRFDGLVMWLSPDRRVGFRSRGLR